MAYVHLLDYVVWGDWLESYLPDFVLAFAFFTGLIFAVLSRRLGLQRSVALVAASLGAALASGLVWWEQVNGLSIRHLGPIAVGFALIVLGGVIYQSIRFTGGSWAGAALALGACLLVGWMLGFDWPVATEIIQTITGAALTVGIIAFLMHHKGFHGHSHQGVPDRGLRTHDLENVHEGQRVSEFLGRGFKRLHHFVTALRDHPEHADDVMVQLKRMLPAEGWLTERMARLRERAHRLKSGHVARIEELRHDLPKLSTPEKRRISTELAARYQELKLDVRLERLDKACAENERRIKEMTRHARESLERGDHRKLVDLLEAASKLQAHNEKLFKTIDRTEKKLILLAKQAAQHPGSVN